MNFEIAAGGSTNASYDITVIEAEGTPQEQSGTTTMLQGMNEYVLCSPTPMDGLVDLNAATPRTQFTVADATVLQDTARYSLSDRNTVNTNNPTCGDGLNYTGQFFATQAAAGGSVNSIVGTLTGSDQAIAKMNDGAVDVTYAGGGWAHSVGVAVTLGGTTFFPYVATVNGTDTIDTRAFGFSVTSTPANGDFATMIYEFNEKISAGAWTSAGYQARTPYMPFNYPGYNAFFKIVNTHSITDGEVTVSGICTNTATGAAVTASGVVGTSVHQQEMTVSSSDIATALGLGTDSHQCAVTLDVNVPSGNINAAGIQIGPDGRTALPMYLISAGQSL